MTRINIEIPDELHKKIKVACAMKQTTIKDYIKEVLDKRLKERRKS
jgi:predicted HicB family RNase H-like nuclease